MSFLSYHIKNLVSSRKKPDIEQKKSDIEQKKSEIKQKKSEINKISFKNSLIKAKYELELLKTGKPLQEEIIA
ncbi:hypothetical protein ASJ81_03585 [Methanosarcina spelaei]|uniref:Uncharacterized protein n=1 Tax=Methanosarcina spelaei TaxID=1036679 RepID=A0A2A2HVM1_9EURY|nr:hypothetical protein ASJ81_03585 [Methanosarcina spelaei]